MNYQQTLDFLYSRLPMFHRIGPSAFKKDLTNTLQLCSALGEPQNKFRSIHIAGTNGKGSVSHMLAAILQAAGYKTGLYTSPHLIDFRERIKINGEFIPEEYVVGFVENHTSLIDIIEPSFFEMTVAMAFDYFAAQKVDVAVIETGLGGRLDSTNVITPLLSVITNISLDHQQLLGSTLDVIAAEKAGIIKQGVPVVIGKHQPETDPVFLRKTKAEKSTLVFAPDEYIAEGYKAENNYLELTYRKKAKLIHLASGLAGEYQVENIATVLAAVENLRNHFNISDEAIAEGIRDVRKLTGFRGRWEVIRTQPLVVCDVAHNKAGISEVFRQVSRIQYRKLLIVYGMVRDKDIETALSGLPQEASYYFCSPDIPRRLPVDELISHAADFYLHGKAFASVSDAVDAALTDAWYEDFVLIVGSVFVVGEALAHFDRQTV